MKAYIVRLLRKLLNWLEAPADPVVLARVRELVSWAETLTVRGEKVSGERKRGQVINRLITEFPDIKASELSYLLELVLRES